jgi:tetratricopeptide (TPR) repeat protein
VYQFRKLVARHKVGFGFIAALFVMAVALAVTMTLEARRIAIERDRANREAATATSVVDFLVGLFEVVDPGEARGNTITAREVLDEGAARISRELTAQPLIQARLMDRMGRVYQGLGLYDRSEPLLKTALAIRRNGPGENQVDVGRSRATLGWGYVLVGRPADAIPVYKEAQEILESRLGRENSEIAWTECHFSAVIAGTDLTAARRLLERSLEVFEKDPGAYHHGISYCSVALSTNLIMAKRYEDAARAAEHALEIEVRFAGSDTPQAAVALNQLGWALVFTGDYVRARPLLDRALAIQERTLGPDHQFVAWTLQSRGELVRRTKQFEASEADLKRALAIETKLSGAYQDEVGNVLTSLGFLYTEMGRYADAEVSYGEALRVLERLGPDHPYLADCLEAYASLLRRMNRGAEAEPLEARALSIRAKSAGESTSAPDSHAAGLTEGR